MMSLDVERVTSLIYKPQQLIDNPYSFVRWMDEEVEHRTCAISDVTTLCMAPI
jgi:hypothetical protein